MTKAVRMTKRAAEQLVKIIELHGSSILPNNDLLVLVNEIHEVFGNFKEKCDEKAKDADGVRVPKPASPRGGLVRAIKRGVDHFA